MPLNQSELTYLCVNGIRHVNPYFHTWCTTVKARWLNRTLIDVLQYDLPSHTKDYYLKALETGVITLNGERASPDTILGMKHIIVHTAHRHEIPILDIPLDVRIQYDPELGGNIISATKPPSWPVHGSAGHWKNSLHSILQIEHGFSNLKLLYRIDKLVSGLVLLTDSEECCKRFLSKFQNRGVFKCYIALAHGDVSSIFEDPAILADPDVTITRVGSFDDLLEHLSMQKLHSEILDAMRDRCASEVMKIKVRHPIRRVDGLRVTFEAGPGVSGDPAAVSAETDFYFMGYDKEKNISRLLASPLTGRTHQIRLHLRSIGFPIPNDVVYGPGGRLDRFRRGEGAWFKELELRKRRLASAADSTSFVTTESDMIPNTASQLKQHVEHIFQPTDRNGVGKKLYSSRDPFIPQVATKDGVTGLLESIERQRTGEQLGIYSISGAIDNADEALFPLGSSSNLPFSATDAIAALSLKENKCEGEDNDGNSSDRSVSSLKRAKKKRKIQVPANIPPLTVELAAAVMDLCPYCQQVHHLKSTYDKPEVVFKDNIYDDIFFYDDDDDDENSGIAASTRLHPSEIALHALAYISGESTYFARLPHWW